MFECPTPCICGKVVELSEMLSVDKDLPDGGDLVCLDCWCTECGGSGDCYACNGIGDCCECGRECAECSGYGNCPKCDGKGYSTNHS